MRNNFKSLALGLISLVLIIIVIGKVVIVAQAPITGEWKADARLEKQGREGETRDGKIQLNLSRSTNGDNHNQFGSDFAYSDLQGLSEAQTQNGRVSFKLVREAGTVYFDGSFASGKGSGTFRFDPDYKYFSAMKQRGFDFEKSTSKNGRNDIEGRMLSAAMLNVTAVLADDLRSVGFGDLDVDDLFKATIFKIDSKFMAEMKATGFPDLKMEDLVKARVFKIDADFVKKVSEMGFGTKDFEQLVKYSIFKVTPEYLAELKAAGFDKLSSEEVVKFRIFKVTPELLTDLKNEGYGKLSAEEVVKFRIFNIDRDFIRRAKAEDPNISVEEMVEMKIGVRRPKGSN
ncbi:hypothetical protein BH10ACI2_BH10ACI2_02580 [soil metagenome]